MTMRSWFAFELLLDALATATALIVGPVPLWEEHFSAKALNGLYFIQIGANCGRSECGGHYRGKLADTSRADPIFEHQRRYCWRGAAIEANPEMFELLNGTYANHHGRVIPINAAIITPERGGPDDRSTHAALLSRAAHDRHVDFFCPTPPPGYDAIAVSELCSMRPDWNQRFAKARTMRVRALSLNELWHLLQPQYVDLLTIDVEGYEYDLLARNDARLVCAPTMVTGKPTQSLFLHFVCERDREQTHRAGRDF